MGGGKEAGATGAPPRRPKTKRLVENRLSGQLADGCTAAIVRQTWVVCTAAVLVVLAFVAGAGVTAAGWRAEPRDERGSSSRTSEMRSRDSAPLRSQSRRSKAASSERSPGAERHF